MMQIAICHENVLPARGGAEMYVADLTRRLVAGGHDVHLYATRWDDAVIPSCVVKHPLPKPRGPRFLRPWRFSSAVRAELARCQPEVSIGFDKLLGADVYYPLGGLHSGTAAHNLLKHRSRAMQLAAKFIQRIDPAHRSFGRIERHILVGPNKSFLVANSDFVRRRAVRDYGLDANDVPVIHNAIDPARFDETDRPKLRDEFRKSWQIEAQEVVGVLIAMNYRLKGLEPLLRALPLIPRDVPFRLLVAGSPKVKPWQQLAEQIGVADRVCFVGHCKDARRLYFASDFLVHPTLYDPCSLVVLEAMACGLPVITTAHNGASERMRPPSDGFVVADPFDSLALATSIGELLKPEQRLRCGREARERSCGWTFDHHVRELEAVLQRAVSRRLRLPA